MLDTTKKDNITSIDLLPIRVLLAESDLSEIARIRSNVDREFQNEIQITNSYHDLLARITKEQPQLLIVGRIDKSNYLEICRDCHKIREKLPIVLITRQKIIDDSFSPLAKTWGAIGVITNNSIELNQLFNSLERPTLPPPNNQPEFTSKPELELETIVTGQIILSCLGEIVAIGNNYFGPLAQGNYWRKAHDRIVDEFPFIVNWSADHFGKIACHESILEQELTTEEIYSLQIWVSIFIQECERIIIDFGKILNNSDLSPPAKNLLAKSS
jgi:hypothetical protein